MSHDPREVLKAHGLWAKKRFGQNFLVAPQVPDQIAAAGGAGPDDVVFEIGAGCGTLTRALARRAGRVIALEYDHDLLPVLRAEMSASPSVEARAGNVLDLDWAAEARAAGRPLVIYGNVPYHLSTDILTGLIDSPVGTWTRACFLLQREFAQRAAAAPGDKGCSALSAAVALHAHATLAFPVSAACFHPRPKVESAVLVLERRAAPAVAVDPSTFRAVVRALFAQRRKMARRALKPICPAPEVLLHAAGLDPTRRGETFTLAELGALTRCLAAQQRPE